MKKIHDQPSALVNAPPSRTPAAPPLPEAAPQTPSARLRSRPSRNVVVRIESAAGDSSAAPIPCSEPERDQRSLRPREPVEQRAHREDHQADHEQPPAPEQVGEPAPQQQDAAEEDRVGGDHPLQAFLGKVEIVRIDGSATLTIATSRTTMNCAATITASTSHFCVRPGRRPPALPESQCSFVPSRRSLLLDHEFNDSNSQRWSATLIPGVIDRPRTEPHPAEPRVPKESLASGGFLFAKLGLMLKVKALGASRGGVRGPPVQPPGLARRG